MNKEELKAEIERVKKLLRENHNPFTQKQNRKYLEKLQRRLKNAEKI